MNPRKPYEKPTKPPSKRKRKEDDKAYSGRAHKKARTEAKNNADPLTMRAHNKFDIVNPETNNTEPLKTAVQMDWEAIETQAENVKEIYSPEVKKIKSHRPIHEITKYSPSGKALEIITPENKTVLPRVLTLGVMSIFSNVSNFELRMKLELEPDTITQAFYNSSQFKEMEEILTSFKTEKTTITQDSLKEAKKEYLDNNSQRVTTQKSVMGTSATPYAEVIFKEVKGMRWEWLHLVAYRILGEKSQTSNNLTGGSYHANTNMMLVEKQIQRLSKRYPEGFDLTVTAELIPGTHFAKNIIYSIKTPDFTIPFTFDALAQNKPHVIFEEYIRILFDSLIIASDQSRNKLKK